MLNTIINQNISIPSRSRIVIKSPYKYIGYCWVVDTTSGSIPCLDRGCSSGISWISCVKQQVDYRKVFYLCAEGKNCKYNYNVLFFITKTWLQTEKYFSALMISAHCTNVILIQFFIQNLTSRHTKCLHRVKLVKFNEMMCHKLRCIVYMCRQIHVHLSLNYMYVHFVFRPVRRAGLCAVNCKIWVKYIILTNYMLQTTS